VRMTGSFLITFLSYAVEAAVHAAPLRSRLFIARGKR
jgi:hypothetical protein